MGIDITTVLKEIKGSLKLGVKFTGFYEKGRSFNHTFAYHDKHEYNYEYMMDHSIVPDDILEYRELATHFNARELLVYLDKIMPTFKNLIIQRKYVNSFSELKDDLILDCTGFKPQKENFVDISNKIPNNRALTYRTPYKNKEQQVPYTHAIAMDYGWVWHTSLRDEMATGYVHCDKYDVKEEFIEHLKKHFDNVDETKIREVEMITGRKEKHILKENGKTIISLGLNSFFIEPLESTGLYMAIYGIKTLDKYLKGEYSEEDYDKSYNHEFDVILDFIVAHYKFSKRDNEYWNKYKNVDIDLYSVNNVFPDKSWYYVLAGFSLSDYNPKIQHESFSKIKNGKSYHQWLEKFK